MSTPTLVLLGSMLAGKSTVGRLAAERLGRPFLDLDDEITRRTGRTPREWFQQQGEGAFRRVEADVALEILGDPVVLALGGGTFMNAEVRMAAREAVTCYLRVPPDVALARISAAERATRPLLDGDASRVLRERFAVRDPIYRGAQYVVDASGSLEDVVAEVLSYA